MTWKPPGQRWQCLLCNLRAVIIVRTIRLHSHWHEYESGYPCAGYSILEFVCTIPMAAVRINTSSVLIWFAFVRVVSARIQSLATRTSKTIELLIYTAHSEDIITCSYWIRSVLCLYEWYEVVILVLSYELASLVRVTRNKNRTGIRVTVNAA